VSRVHAWTDRRRRRRPFPLPDPVSAAISIIWTRRFSIGLPHSTALIYTLRELVILVSCVDAC
jgi:hypothetical protein